ncbi:hypothetical protein [Clostridium estertheticum]|uniref:Uncharacterized protein n=1 Tax=Clostridium estertheticum TaxID=238834 RepID=A0A7Y3WUJ3_9CLOT|nr:hypothetical protein [Clostridium estertheticum]NNU78148.1 hypothetical protein [Clostridium estertheticum]WBL47739.1 hypothetical protein LOR37_03350 [Clostridium estertheticum]
MAKNKISISFSKRNLDLYTILKAKDNSSNYICSLIRANLETSNEGLDFKIEQILNKILKDKQLIYSNSNKPLENIDSGATDEDVDLILSIF